MAPPRPPAPRRRRANDATDTATEGDPTPKTRAPRAGTKRTKLIAMLREPEGASIPEIVATTGWQPHMVRGAIAGALKKKLRLNVVSERDETLGGFYRIKC